MSGDGCLEKLNIIRWVIDIGFAVVPAIALVCVLLFLNKKLKGSKYELAKLLGSQDDWKFLLKLRLLTVVCVILIVPSSLYAQNKWVEPVLLGMYKECWAAIYPRQE